MDNLLEKFIEKDGTIVLPKNPELYKNFNITIEQRVRCNDLNKKVVSLPSIFVFEKANLVLVLAVFERDETPDITYLKKYKALNWKNINSFLLIYPEFENLEILQQENIF